jgi:hypothetical protein
MGLRVWREEEPRRRKNRTGRRREGGRKKESGRDGERLEWCVHVDVRMYALGVVESIARPARIALDLSVAVVLEEKQQK